MDDKKKNETLAQHKELETVRLKINDLKNQVKARRDQLLDGQKEVEHLKTVLTDAKRRLEIMKKRDIQPRCSKF